MPELMTSSHTCIHKTHSLRDVLVILQDEELPKIITTLSPTIKAHLPEATANGWTVGVVVKVVLAFFTTEAAGSNGANLHSAVSYPSITQGSEVSKLDTTRQILMVVQNF